MIRISKKSHTTTKQATKNGIKFQHERSVYYFLFIFCVLFSQFLVLSSYYFLVLLGILLTMLLGVCILLKINCDQQKSINNIVKFTHQFHKLFMCVLENKNRDLQIKYLHFKESFMMIPHNPALWPNSLSWRPSLNKN